MTTVGTRLVDARKLRLVSDPGMYWWRVGDFHCILVRHDGELISVLQPAAPYEVDGIMYPEIGNRNSRGMFSIKDPGCWTIEIGGICGCGTWLRGDRLSYTDGDVCEKCWLLFGVVMGTSSCIHGITPE